MKMIFIQQYSSLCFGVLALMSHLRYHGINCEVIVWQLEDKPVEILYDLKPDLIGISLMTTEHFWMVEAVKEIRKKLPETKMIVGGIHATIYPDDIMEVPGVDLVCNSDGEQVLLEVCNALEGSSNKWSSIEGLTYRDEGGIIHHNKRANFFNFLPEIVEDRTPYFSRYPVMSKDTVPRFIASRGCPYNCNFCYNEQIKELFNDNGKYLRYKDPENLIREISGITRNFNVESVFFVDDLFTMNKKWLADFLKLYKNDIDSPFMCTTRANLMDDSLAKILSEAGCQTVSFGIETGNEFIREKVLNKKISDEQIIRCGKTIQKYGMQIQTANMFCLPGESLQDAYKTIEINHKAGTHLAFCSLFLPFPNTSLAKYCIENGYLKSDYSFDDLPKSFLTKSMISLKDKMEIVNVQQLSYFFIRYPWFYKNFRWVVKFQKLKPLFFLIYLLSNFLRHKEERGRSYFSAFLYAWQFRKTI
jgi:anaerobic magnesium-protoporphyrin IX monomethyl ester cyclase